MERYIGLDAHASSCTLGVVGPSGKRLGSHVVETNARALIELMRRIPRNRHVCVEEGTLSGWLYEVLEPHVEEVVVAGVRESPGLKSDKRDAFALAEQLRIGSLETVVYKDRGRFRRLGQLARAHGFVVRDTVRVKNRLKSVYRSRGLGGGKGRSVYGKRERGGWLADEPQNLWWAAGYNVFAIPLAAGVIARWGVLLPPVFATVLMSLSTVIVALNAQLLRRVDLSVG